MKNIYSSLVIYLFFIFQTTIIEKLKIFGVKPNILLVLLIGFSSFGEKKGSILHGFLIGFIYDIISGSLIGVNSFLFMYIALICNIISPLINRNFLLNTACTFFFTFIYNIFHIIIFMLTKIKKINICFFASIFVECFYNSLISLIIFACLYKIFLRKRAQKTI